MAEDIKKKKPIQKTRNQQSEISLQKLLERSKTILNLLESNAASELQNQLKVFLTECYMNGIFHVQVMSLTAREISISIQELEYISNDIREKLSKEQRSDIFKKALEGTLSVIQAYNIAQEKKHSFTLAPTRPRPSSTPTTTTKDSDKKQPAMGYNALASQLQSFATKPADRKFLTLCRDHQLFDWNTIPGDNSRKKIATALATALEKLESEQVAHSTKNSLMMNLSVNLHKLASNLDKKLSGELTATYLSQLKSIELKATTLIKTYRLTINPDEETQSKIKIDAVTEQLKSLLDQFLTDCYLRGLTTNSPPKEPKDTPSYLKQLFLDLLSRPPTQNNRIFTSLIMLVGNIIIIYPNLHHFKKYFSEKQCCYRAAKVIKANNERIATAFDELKKGVGYQIQSAAIEHAMQDCLTHADVITLFKLELQIKSKTLLTLPEMPTLTSKFASIELETLPKNDPLIESICDNIRLLCERYCDFLWLYKLPKPSWVYLVINMREHRARLDAAINEFNSDHSLKKGEELRSVYDEFCNYCKPTLMELCLEQFNRSTSKSSILKFLREINELTLGEQYSALNIELNAAIKLLETNKYLCSYQPLPRSLSYTGVSSLLSPSFRLELKERTQSIPEILNDEKVTDKYQTLKNKEITEVIAALESSIDQQQRKNAQLLYDFLILRSRELPFELKDCRNDFMKKKLSPEKELVSLWQSNIKGYLESVLLTNPYNYVANDLLTKINEPAGSLTARSVRTFSSPPPGSPLRQPTKSPTPDTPPTPKTTEEEEERITVDEFFF